MGIEKGQRPELGWTYNTDNPRLLRDLLRAPCKVAAIETQRPVFEVSATNTDGVDTFYTELGACGLTSEFELSFLAVVGTLCACCRSLVS